MKVTDNEDNAAMCICPNCPTYNGCMEDAMGMLFCGRGRTTCDLDKAGCLCGECPVATNYRLGDLYYCENGAAE